MIGEKLLSATCRLRTGLRALTRIDDSTDCFDLLPRLFASGDARMMKVVISGPHLETPDTASTYTASTKGRRN